MGAVSVIPATGWVALGASVGYTVLERTLPANHAAYWYFNGAGAIASPTSVPSISASLGDSSAVVVAGGTLGVGVQLLATLTQVSVFGAELLDWIDGVVVGFFAACPVPESVVDACGAVASVLTACAAPGAAAWSVSDG